MTERKVSSERVSEERLKLWFFRDLSSEQRLKLFGLLGMPVEEIGDIHGHQTKAFRHMLLALRPSVKKLEWPPEIRRGQRVMSGYGLIQYTICHYGGTDPNGGTVYRWAAQNEGWHGPLFSYEDARAAAQADYERRILSALEATTPQEVPSEVTHPDDIAVDRFAAAMKAKLAKKREEGRGGWERKDECSADFLSDMLREHVVKGDPVDVANFAMMLHQRGERIAAASSEVTERDALLEYVLQDDLHNRLTPRIVDIAYTAFNLAKQPNNEDGGPSDWFTDTKPTVDKMIEKVRAALAAALKGDRP